MTGQTPKLHGDRIFQKDLKMPSNTKTIAQTFRDNGYQALQRNPCYASKR